MVPSLLFGILLDNISSCSFVISIPNSLCNTVRTSEGDIIVSPSTSSRRNASRVDVVLDSSFRTNAISNGWNGYCWCCTAVMLLNVDSWF